MTTIKVQQLRAKKGFKKSISALILIAVSVAVIFWAWTLISKPEVMVGVITESENGDSNWKTYINEDYDFKIDFPKDWKVYESPKGEVPVINIYKPQFDKQPPFDYFSDVNSISIFPQGIETEALIGEVAPFESEVVISDESVDVEKITDYILQSGVVWARYITFNSTPKSWKQWGSVWARSEIVNLEFSCNRDGSEILMEECNPFGGDAFIRTGTVDPVIIEIQKQILESLVFLN